MDRRITFYHAPQTRSGGTLVLLEELGAEYDLHLLDMKAGEQRQPAYLAVNPMGKVPAIRHRGELVTEQVAVALYLADLHPEAGLAPALDDPQRGPYLRWFAFYAGCYEPALVDRSLKREPGSRGMVGYGDYDTVVDTVIGQLRQGPWFLGERFTALDVQWGNALAWTLAFGLVPPDAVLVSYSERCNARPAFVRAKARDAELAAAQEAARQGAPA